VTFLQRSSFNKFDKFRFERDVKRMSDPLKTPSKCSLNLSYWLQYKLRSQFIINREKNHRTSHIRADVKGVVILVQFDSILPVVFSLSYKHMIILYYVQGMDNIKYIKTHTFPSNTTHFNFVYFNATCLYRCRESSDVLYKFLKVRLNLINSQY
jgi:hypothetical protein